MPGRSWYPIDELERRDPASVTAAADAVLRWIDAEAADASSIALLDSPRAPSVALQAARRDPERIAAVVNLSGYAAPGDLPGDAELRERRTPVFWGAARGMTSSRPPSSCTPRSGCRITRS
jgi:phospholipase/carboxylesterase